MGSSTGAAADIWSRKPLNDAPKSVGEMAMEMVPSGVDSPGARSSRAVRAGPVRPDSFTIPLEAGAGQCGAVTVHESRVESGTVSMRFIESSMGLPCVRTAMGLVCGLRVLIRDHDSKLAHRAKHRDTGTVVRVGTVP